MSKGGRDYIPGEKDQYLDLRDHRRYLSRIIRGQISDVRADVGRVQVKGVIPAIDRPITIKPLWFSASPSDPQDEASKPYTAWGRYMPIGNEMVEIAYRNDDTPVIIGYDITATENEERAGYNKLTEARDNGSIAYSSFRDLKPGEFDFKSAGNAYIFGSKFGTLFLAGSQAFIRLVGQDYRIESKASEYNFKSDSTQFRIGTVFRKALPTDQKENPVTKLDGGTYKEFLVDIADSNASGIALSPSKIKLHFGDILDDTTLEPEISESSKNLRARIIVGSDTLQESFKLEIDESGNIIWNQNTTTATDGLKLRASPILFNATSGSGTSGGIVKINNTNINLGAEDAKNKAVLWDPGLRQELDNLKTAVSNNSNDIKTHGHPLPYQSLGIPTGEVLQTFQTKFTGSVDAGFFVVEPVQKAGDECKSNSGPMNLKSDIGETNEIDSVKPRELGGFFKNEYNPGDPSSIIVKIEE
jgi:hypothetical protein